MRRFVALTLCLFLSLWPAARADQNGVALSKPYSCSGDAMSALSFLCDALKAIGVKTCTVTGDSCVNASQEVFSGLNIELASPTNIKNWSGYGGTGEIYAAAALCLLKDLKTTPMTSHAKASLGIGNISTQQTVGLLSFDPKALRLEGWHRARACAPIVGCFDGFTQKFTLQAVATDLKTSPEKVGQYQVHSTHALDLTAQGQTQALVVDIKALAVKTPYGEVEATPHFAYGKSVGWVLAPYAGNNIKSTWKSPVAPQGPMMIEFGAGPRMLDLYGRFPGLKRSQAMPGPLPGQPTLMRLPIDPFRGWISQAGLGGRTVPEATLMWTPPAGVEYPERPDFALHKPITPRSDLEKLANLAMGADVKVDYSPTDLLPAFIRDSGLVTIDFHVFVQPAIGAAFGSQLHLLNMEASKWTPHPAGSPLPPYSPDTYHVAREFHARAGSSAAAAFKVTAGVDLRIEIKIPLIFKTIKKTLINIHPRYEFVNATSDGTQLSARSAHAATYSAAALTSGKLFQSYRRLDGAQADAAQHLQACLAGPKVQGDPPPPPKAEPGDPEDFEELIDYPCNICIGSTASEANVKPTNKLVKFPAWVKTIFPSHVNNRPAAVRTRCDNTGHIGCLDRCSWNKSTNVLTVIETAQEMYAAGRADRPRCHAKLPPLLLPAPGFRLQQ
jgi:hypothetical protein